jgi:hypothetical protein
MRPWFTFIVTFILVVALLVLLFVVNFVLSNREMFEAKFDVIIPLPYVAWSHTWEGVQFMYIITGSILLGALIIAITTLGLDTKRALKLRSMRKELIRLQEALQKAQSVQEAQKPDETEQLPEVVEESVEVPDSAAITPEDITKSFEDTIQKDDFLGESNKRFEDEQREENIEGSSVQASVTEETGNEEVGTEQEPVKEKKEDSLSDRDKKLLEETPVEAELVESEEDSQKKKNEA